SGEAVGIDSPLRPWFQQRYAALQRQVAGGLRRALDGGRLRAGVDVDAAAAEALAVMDGLQLQYLLDDDADTYLARFAAYIDRLVVSLSA
ncbi:MAG TPA: TetR family transcriptional regulator C-terminal domain-containing protein, partial [Dermatophilaceae bacterium]|nr:TetR family transcriptional regulator C-terminal domain-containing protein [Dermatophilaceae bacterium]